MKKILVLLAFALLYINSFSQFDNEFYFRFGYSNPSWKQYDLTEDEFNQFGLNKKMGLSFELGTIFMLNKLLQSDQAVFGIDADYLSLTYNHFYVDRMFKNGNFAHLRASSKVGPSFTYSPVDKLAFDVYAKANLVWSSVSVFFDEVYSDADDFYLGQVKMGFSTGLNIRYDILMVGFEYETVSPMLESDDNPGRYLQEDINAIFGKSSNDQKSKVHALNFTLGLNF